MSSAPGLATSVLMPAPISAPTAVLVPALAATPPAGAAAGGGAATVGLGSGPGAVDARFAGAEQAFDQILAAATQVGPGADAPRAVPCHAIASAPPVATSAGLPASAKAPAATRAPVPAARAVSAQRRRDGLPRSVASGPPATGPAAVAAPANPVLPAVVPGAVPPDPSSAAEAESHPISLDAPPSGGTVSSPLAPPTSESAAGPVPPPVSAEPVAALAARPGASPIAARTTEGPAACVVAAPDAPVASLVPTFSAAPISVASRAAGPAASAPPAAQVRPAVTLAVSSGARHVVVALHPAELGQVEIHIERGAAGMTHISLAAARPETLAALREDDAQLGQALDRAGLPAHARTVSFAALTAPDASGDGGETGRHRPDTPPGGRSEAEVSSQQRAGQDQAGQDRTPERAPDRHPARTPARTLASPGGRSPSADFSPSAVIAAPARWVRLGVDITA